MREKINGEKMGFRTLIKKDFDTRIEEKTRRED